MTGAQTGRVLNKHFYGQEEMSMSQQQIPDSAQPYDSQLGGQPNGYGPNYSVGRPLPNGQRAMGPYNPPTSSMASGPGGGMPGGSAANMAAAVDIIGPILRRKFLVVLLALIGFGVSLLLYSSQEITYESTARLMVSSQAPPMLVEGNTIQQKVAIPKHQKLITSQLVLGNAIETGKLGTLNMFQTIEPELYIFELQENILSIKPSREKDDETLTIGAQGKYADELPRLLTAVIRAYENEIAKDTQQSGRENLQLITRLREQLESEKRADEVEYQAILRKIDLPNIEQGDKLVNPYNAEIERLALLKDEVVSDLRDCTNRVETATEIIGNPTPAEMNYLVAEAKKYLSIVVETKDTVIEGRLSHSNYLGSNIATRLFNLEKELGDLILRRETTGRSLANGHPQMVALQRQIQVTSALLEQTRVQFEKTNEQLAISDTMESNLEARLERTNQHWIDVYYSAIKAEHGRLSSKLSLVDADLVDREAKARSVSSDFLQLIALKSRILDKQKNIDDVIAKLSEIDVVSTNFTETKVRVIDRPGDGVRVAPSLLKFSAIGLFLGGLLGVGLAVLIDRSDMTFRNPGEIFERLKVPVICKLPAARVPRKQQSGKINPALTCLHKPTSKMAEAVRAARTSLLFTAQSDGSKVFLFSSPSPGDGKSTATGNLAISLAQAGKKVLLVDADFRRPRVHTYFAESIEPGIMQVVAGTETLENCIKKSEQDGLFLLTCGGRPKNPGELVTSAEFAKMIAELRTQFDMILIDSPPLLPVADAAVISSLVDGVYLVIRIRKGIVVTSAKSKEKLDMVNANLLGIIVNGVDDNPHYNEYGSYGYGYGYEYGYGYGNGNYYESRNSRYQEKIGSS